MIVHRFWTGPRRNLEWSRRVIQNTQGCPVNDWNPNSLPDDARWALSANPRDASNRVRYWLLATFGGIWLDCDVIPLRPLPIDQPWTAALGREREGSAICFPEPGHPMAEELLEVARRAPASAGQVWTTGAYALNLVGRKYPDVRLEPRVLPYDAGGHPMGIDEPLAVHLWESSAAINLEVPRARA